MRIESYLAEIRRGLFKRGIMGRPAARLLEELDDHFQTLVQQAREAGNDAETAQRAALQALGKPVDVAKSAADNLKSAGWIAGHPYLFSLAVGGSALAANVLFLVGVMALAEYESDGTSDNRVLAEVLAGLMNWLVLIGGGVWLWSMTRRYVLGWRALFCAVVAMAIFISVLGVLVVPSFAPGFGPKSGGVSIVLEGSPLGMLYMTCTGEPYSPSQVAAIFSPWHESGQLFFSRLLAPVLALLALRYMSPANTEVETKPEQ